MKKCIKTVCIALCISITMNLFSSYKKVEAVATTTAASAIVVYAVGAIIAALTTYFIVDNADEICNFVNSASFSDTLVIDDDGTCAINPTATIPEGINPVTFNALEKEAVKATNSHIHFSNSGGEHGGGGKNRMPSGDFQNGLSAAVTGLAAALVNEAIEGIQTKNAYENVYGESGFMNRDIQVIDGKPQHVTSSYTPEVINVFERLGLKYTILNSVTDTHLYYRQGAESNYQMGTCYQSFIMKDGKIYVLGSQNGEGYFYSFYDSNYGSWAITLVGSTPFQIRAIQPYLPKNQTFEIKLTQLDSRLCVAYYSSYVSSNNQGYEYQNICGKPQPSTTPILFEKPDYSYSGNMQSYFNNYATDKPLLYTNILDRSDVLSDTDVLSFNYDVCGYVQGNDYTAFSSSGNLGSAALIMGEYDSPVSGGHSKTNSELTDLEKAIYTLAQQQGIGYEQMLEQSKIIMDNGQLYIEGLDGISYSISSLVSEFDRLVEQGKITADQATATTEQLKAVLEYLKSLNIEGIEAYIQQIEAALDALQQGDINREALLGDISGILSDMKNYLDTADLEGLATSVSNVEASLNDIKDLLDSLAVADDLVVSDIENINSDLFIDKFPFSLPFDLYHIVTLFVRDPVEPVFTVPIETKIEAFGLSEEIDEEIILDLTIFQINGVDIVQLVSRFCFIIGFIVMLIKLTTKLFV